MPNTTDSAIVGLIHKYDETETVTLDLLIREIPDAFHKDGCEVDFTTALPAVEDAYLLNRADFAISILTNRMLQYKLEASQLYEGNDAGIPYLLNVLSAFTENRIIPYSQLAESARERYETTARNMLYPDLRMAYRDHKVLVDMLARNLYYLEKEDKLQGGSLD